MKGTILVVDDEQIIREQIRTVLEFHGYQVMEAENAPAPAAMNM